MKAKPVPAATPLVNPPSETPRPDVTVAMNRHSPRPTAAHGYGLHDRRRDIAHAEAGERIHARQVEPRTAADCHVRARRRPKVEGAERNED
ncbi:MAG: hypothetical protein JSR48_14185 [Verrucomicrobia bacterium]|nr:hypothetical protein [Verrucomicrobiota bacterium]